MKKYLLLFLLPILAASLGCAGLEGTISYDVTEYEDSKPGDSGADYEDTNKSSGKNSKAGAPDFAITQSVTGISETSDSKKDTLTDRKEDNIYVAVTGCVVEPGVYIMASDSRVFEAINAAGGFTKEGDMDSVNLVLKVYDGMTVHVRSKEKEGENTFVGKDAAYSENSNGLNQGTKSVYGDVGISGEGNGGTSGGNSKININSSDINELVKIPGVGEARAKAILEYRAKNGDFKKIEDIMKVSGIKEGTFEKIKDSITVS